MKLSNTDHILKIVAIGPESTGKSTLCTDLALHFSTHWCQEYAREYLIKNGTNYSYEDLLLIAKGQLALEEKALIELSIDHSKNDSTKRPLLFIDTDMYVMKVWCEYVFNNCHPFILEQINHRQYDFYLLCNIDLPWTADEMREYPDEKPRQELFSIYKDILINQNTPWGLVGGHGDTRLRNAIQLIDTAFP